jgi:hypothetical protein
MFFPKSRTVFKPSCRRTSAPSEKMLPVYNSKRWLRKPMFQLGGFSHTTLTRVVYHEVLAEADAWGADLIIVGSHSPSMGTYLLGSNAQKIVRHANCSVLVVRPQKDRHGNYWLFPQIAS